MAGSTVAGAATTGARPLAGAARAYLASVEAGGSPAPDPAVWSSLAPRGAVAGSPAHPEITDVGRHVLRELELRAYRTDDAPLDDVAQEIDLGVTMLATMADTAEYFLAELGPVPPVEVVPFLRIVAAHLAVRHESPEELVAEFTNGWGGAEVLEGSPDDRLLAAELITGAGVPQDEFYAALTTTVERLRDAGCSAPVASAAILHLFPAATNAAPLDRWTRFRERVASDEGAALLAGFPDLAATTRQWEGNVEALEGDGVVDAERAGIYLTATAGAAPPELLERSREVSRLLEGTFRLPLLAGAVAASHLPLAPAETADWLAKSTAAAASHHVAPNAEQLSVIGLALLHGLDPASFRMPGGARRRTTTAAEGLVARTALHAWMFRDLVSAPTPGS